MEIAYTGLGTLLGQWPRPLNSVAYLEEVKTGLQMTVLFLCSLSLLPQKWNLTSPGPYFCPRLATCTRNPGLYLSRIAEKAMAPHSSTLAWKIPWTEEPGGLQSMGSRLSNFTFTFDFHALEKEMATHSSVLAWRIPGTGELVGCRLWGRTESDMTEAT